MNCFPILYEDELLYSIIARYKQMCGIISKKALIRDLFGGEVTLSSAYFPTHLKKLINNLPYTSKLTEDIILEKHTLYPLLTSFLSDEATKDIYSSVKEGKDERVILKIGFMNSSFKMGNKLKFCPKCLKEDIEVLGESYWRRSHQIPGVFFCIKHECKLLESTIQASESRVFQECASEDTCIEYEESILLEDKYIKLNLEFSKEVNYLLNNTSIRKGLSFIIDYYIDRLRELGLTSKSGNIYMDKLEKKFIRFYSPQYLKIMQVEVDTKKNSNWLRLFVRNNKKNRNYVKHILFLHFLGVRVEDLFKCNEVIGRKRVGNKHKPRLNKDEMRNKWIDIVKDNPSASRTELKEVGKGNYTWLYRHDRDWLQKTLPPLKIKTGQKSFVDWKKRDEVCLEKSKIAVEEILKYEGKPVRVCRATIRRHLGLNTWFNNKKLVKTHEYILEVKEEITDYRIRKIKWAISEMLEQKENITPYKLQLHAGFGGNNKEVRGLIEKELIKN